MYTIEKPAQKRRSLLSPATSRLQALSKLDLDSLRCLVTGDQDVHKIQPSYKTFAKLDLLKPGS